MSKYSGKCDLADWIEIVGGYDEFVKRGTRIYVGWKNYEKKKELIYTKESELMPYYPYIECASTGSMIVLSDRPWPDIEKEDFDKCGIEHRMYGYYKKFLAEDIEKQKQKEAANE